MEACSTTPWTVPEWDKKLLTVQAQPSKPTCSVGRAKPVIRSKSPSSCRSTSCSGPDSSGDLSSSTPIRKPGQCALYSAFSFRLEQAILLQVTQCSLDFSGLRTDSTSICRDLGAQRSDMRKTKRRFLSRSLQETFAEPGARGQKLAKCNSRSRQTGA